MTQHEYPFAALTEKQLTIVKAYERLRHDQNMWGVPVARRVAEELDRKLDVNKGNSYVYRVLKKWHKIKSNKS